MTVPTLLHGQAAVTPEQFGAVGDGTSDDAPAIQRALDANRSVRLRGGARYLISKSVHMSSGATLAGGPDSALLPMDTAAIIINGASDVRVEDLTIIGQRQRYRRPDNHGVLIDWRRRRGRDVAVRRVSVREVAGAGVVALAGASSSARGFTVDGCVVANVGAHGIIAQDYIDNVLFERNEVHGTGLLVADRPGITASRFGSGVVIRDNRCFGSPNAVGSSVHGISLDRCSDAICTGNVVRNWTQGYGIEAGGVREATVAGNDVCDGRYGIVLSGWTGSFNCDQVVIERNTIERMAATGIFSFMAHGPGYHRSITLRNNIIRQITGQQMGIGAFLTDVDGLRLEGLDVRECNKSGIYLIDCTNFDIRTNRSIGNNPAGDPAHAGLAVRWLHTPANARGRNLMSDNDISGNGGGRNLVYFDS